MIAPEDPPSFVVRTEAQKAAWDNGFRLERRIESGWLRYASTTAPGTVWIAGVSAGGPWLLSIEHSGVAAELGGLHAAPIPGRRQPARRAAAAVSRQNVGAAARD
jgi:hypothetical protein